MKKISAVVALLAVAAFVAPVSAKVSFTPDLPDQAGIYDVPGHPDMKLRVFVHKAAKPGPVTPVLVCDLPDGVSTDKVPGAGWHLPAQWVYNLNELSVPSSIDTGTLPTIAERAYAAWSAEVPSTTVQIRRGPNTEMTRAASDNKNIITWGRTSGSALAVSYIWYNRTTEIASEVDTVFNSKYRWYWADQTAIPAGENPMCAYAGGYDAQDILTHELGHTFGLSDVYEQQFENATMYGYGSPGQVNAITLSTGDKEGVQALYQR